MIYLLSDGILGNMINGLTGSCVITYKFRHHVCLVLRSIIIWVKSLFTTKGKLYTIPKASFTYIRGNKTLETSLRDIERMYRYQGT